MVSLLLGDLQLLLLRGLVVLLGGEVARDRLVVLFSFDNLYLRGRFLMELLNRRH